MLFRSNKEALIDKIKRGGDRAIPTTIVVDELKNAAAEAYAHGLRAEEIDALRERVAGKQWEKFSATYKSNLDKTNTVEAGAGVAIDPYEKLDFSKEHPPLLYILNFASKSVRMNNGLVDYLITHEKIHAASFDMVWQKLRVATERGEFLPKDAHEMMGRIDKFFLSLLLDDPSLSVSLVIHKEDIASLFPSNVRMDLLWDQLNKDDKTSNAAKNSIKRMISGDNVDSSRIYTIQEIATMTAHMKINPKQAKSAILNVADSGVDVYKKKGGGSGYVAVLAQAYVLYTICGEKEKADAVESLVRSEITKNVRNNPDESVSIVMEYLLAKKTYLAASRILTSEENMRFVHDYTKGLYLFPCQSGK